MEFDQTYNQGAADWSFPSPTATPTSATFNNASVHCQTPKSSTFPSHFQDAFATPQMQGFATPSQPGHPSMTPIQRPQTSSEMLSSNYFADFHASGGRDAGHGQGQYVHLHNHGNLHVPTATPILPSNAPPLPSQQPALAQSFDSSHIRTPPPTRGASVKKNMAPQPIAFGTPSTIASRRFATPQQQEPMPHPMPASHPDGVHFPQLQFPTDNYQFDDFGPASAPVFPQSQILWGSPSVYQQPTTLDDPFAPSAAADLSWPSPAPMPTSAQAVNFQTPKMRSFSTQTTYPKLAPAIPSSAAIPQAPQSDMTSGGVNPSLVYSSPVRPIEQPKVRTTKPRAHVSQEELRRRPIASAEHARTETQSSAESMATTSSRGLRRTKTTGTADLLKAQASLRASDNVLQIPRTASPQKRIGRAMLGSISEAKKLRPRTSVVLTIDENGRARTETRPLEDSPTTRSMRERYPGLFDSDSSDAESEESEQPLSRSASFSFARGEERKIKAARLDPPVENLEGLTIPRSSSFTSTKVGPSRAALAAAAQLRRDGSVRKRTPSHHTQRRAISSAISPLDKNLMDLAPALEPGASGLPEPDRRLSMMSLEQQSRQASISPTHQPFGLGLSHSQQSGQHTRPIRCTCGVNNDDSQPLIQCESCLQCLHIACTGIRPTESPQKFTCVFCTSPGPSIRPSKVRGR